MCIRKTEREGLDFTMYFKLTCQRVAPNFIIYFPVTSTRMPARTEHELDNVPVPATQKMKLQKIKAILMEGTAKRFIIPTLNLLF